MHQVNSKSAPFAELKEIKRNTRQKRKAYGSKFENRGQPRLLASVQIRVQPVNLILGQIPKQFFNINLGILESRIPQPQTIHLLNRFRLGEKNWTQRLFFFTGTLARDLPLPFPYLCCSTFDSRLERTRLLSPTLTVAARFLFWGIVCPAAQAFIFRGSSLSVARSISDARRRFFLLSSNEETVEPIEKKEPTSAELVSRFRESGDDFGFTVAKNILHAGLTD